MSAIGEPAGWQREYADYLRAKAEREGKPIQHVCGLSGFGQSLNDVCPACEEMHERWRRR
jgi:hypothetical protein